MRGRWTRRIAGAALVALSLLGSPAVADTRPLDRGTHHGGCSDRIDEAVPFAIEVAGETARGHIAYPDRYPEGLVVFSHGYGHTSASWKEHMRRVAAEHRWIAVAMDYRGTRILNPDAPVPSSRGWRVAEGAVDGIAAAQHLDLLCTDMRRLVNFGVSMGGNTSGLMAAAGATRPSTGGPLFDFWVAVEPAVNVLETYAGASLVAPVNAYAANAKADIEEAMGGTPSERPEVYRDRSVVTRAADIKASGVRSVVLIHGVDDGLVPYNQTREMAAALDRVGQGYQVYTVVRRGDGEAGTTATGTLLGQAGYTSPFAGHASETSTTHLVMQEAFTVLWRLATGYLPPPGCVTEYVSDGETGFRSQQPTRCHP